MLFDIIGFIGILTLLGAYALMQTQRIRSDGWRYSLLNLLGSVEVMIALLKDWNLSAFVLEALWGLISIYGMVKALKLRIK